jgi:hypothetical protein
VIGRRRPGPGAPVPADLRTRLERARLETLALLRALDHAAFAPRQLPQLALAHLAELDAGCAEALWALDQPPGALDVDAMVRDTLTALGALEAARAQVRHGLPAASRPRVENLEPLIRATLDPHEAYNDVPGRDPQNR